MTKVLHVAEDRTLPVEILQDSTTIFGRKRSGKSNNAVVLVEEALDLHSQVVVLDPKGDWWGITSSFDGKSEGYPVVVIGGNHATIELDLRSPGAGITIANWILDTGYSVIIDLSLLKDPERERFCAPFLETIRRRKSEKPGQIILVVDEADELAPEDQRERIHVIDTYRTLVWMVKRGGFAGVATICITQRPASISKNITTQSETIVVLHVSGSQDVDAVSDALKHHVPGATKKERTAALEDLLREIVQLDKGATIVVSASPKLKGQIHRIPFRRRRTFDSGATPEFGKQARAPRVVAMVAIERLSAAMEKAVAEAKANDPREKDKVIATLRRELEGERKRQPATTPAPKPKTVYVLKEGQLARAEKVVERGHELVQKFRDAGAAAATFFEQKTIEYVGDLGAMVGPLAAAISLTKQSAPSSPPPSSVVRGRTAGSNGDGEVRAGVRSVETAQTVNRPKSTPPPGSEANLSRKPASARTPERAEGDLTAAERRMLVTIAELSAAGIDATRTALGAWQGLRSDTGRFGSYLSRLIGLGLITQDGSSYEITVAGQDTVGVAYAPSAEELRDRVRARLKGRERDVFDEVLKAGDITRDALGERMGLRGDTGRFGGYLARLRDMGAIEYERGQVRVGEHLAVTA